MNEDTSPSLDSSPSFIREHLPKEKEVQYLIGPYQVLSSVGKGGMGEVLLAYDTKCGRRVALKRIREDLLEHKLLNNRFLKEARITAQLTHPAIMPIYAIEDENNIVYYTMPFVQGETLKQIIRTTREDEKNGRKPHHIGGSIPALVRIYISVCQAVAYAHSKGVLHRDLKPENIMVGEYGEVLILDWGLAKLVSTPEDQEEEAELRSPPPFHELTRPGKVVGTINYMAPERAKGGASSVQTEIYSLGVILYQILTLRNPFRRGSIEDFRKNCDSETLSEPSLIAPYRDVPHLLSRIAMKCLSKHAKERYRTVDELIREIENYIEGRSEWFQIGELDIHKKEDWEFQENVLIAEHIAITRDTELTDWVSLMISKISFTENTKIEAEVTIKGNSYGIGFLMSIPESAERTHLNDGYCLWLGSDINKSTKLLRSTVEVLQAPEVYLQRNVSYRVKIKKIDHNIYFYLNDTLQFSYISHLPLVGTHIGILSRDADFSISNFKVFVGNLNITVNCLAVPDAFLAHKDYATALIEYRRIGYSFPGRAEGREAMFRAGITILEQAKTTFDASIKEELYDASLTEFEKLHSTPGAPLEYLGKAHVYQAMNDEEEEVKCYELGFRKFPKHPLLSVLYEQLIYRMHETARTHRKATYLFMLTALRHLPQAIESSHTKKLFERLQKHWEPLYFICPDPEAETYQELKNLEFRIKLAFWLASPLALSEIFDEAADLLKMPTIIVANALFCLIELGAWGLAKLKLESLSEEDLKATELELIQTTILCHETSPRSAYAAFLKKKHPRIEYGEARVLLHIAETGIQKNDFALAKEIYLSFQNDEMPEELIQRLELLAIWSSLMNGEWESAGKLLHKYPLTLLTRETTLLFTLYGCWLAAVENKEIAEIHFSGVLDVSYPRTWNLLSHYINGKVQKGKWEAHSFLWEKRQLYRVLELYYHCIGDKKESDRFHDLEKAQYITS